MLKTSFYIFITSVKTLSLNKITFQGIGLGLHHINFRETQFNPNIQTMSTKEKKLETKVNRALEDEIWKK